MIVLMLPMWMNFLLRTYAWMSLLENTGILNELFNALGIFKLINAVFGTDISYFPMINTKGAVVRGHGIQLPALHDPAHLHRH